MNSKIENYMNVLMGLKDRRKQILRYKPSNHPTARECENFLKYCPSKRERVTFCNPTKLLIWFTLLIWKKVFNNFTCFFVSRKIFIQKRK